MSGTYKATGINLKGMAFGESDRLLTVLTREYGLIRAIAPGSRKHDSSLRGRSGLFVINALLIAKGRSLDKITQAESLESFPGLSQSLPRLTASQYLAELTLYQALSDQPQEELFDLLRQILHRLEQLPAPLILPCLTHAIFQLLTLAGVAPQVDACCLTKQPLLPDFTNSERQVGFSVVAGGIVNLSALDQLPADALAATSGRSTDRPSIARATEPTGAYRVSAPSQTAAECLQLNATELALLQHLSEADLVQSDGTLRQLPASLTVTEQDWLAIERVLRQYAQYYFERPIRSAALIDTCFLPQISS
jgi:DNA repair protein RecO (recombination protein O)